MHTYDQTKIDSERTNGHKNGIIIKRQGIGRGRDKRKQ